MYEIGKEELSALEALFQTKKFFRYQGAGIDTQTSLFEKEFSIFLGMPHSLFVTSGTNALTLALEVLGVGPGDEVIIPSYTFIATASSVLRLKATPVISGIGEGLTMDPSLLRSKITPRTKAIIPVHMDGLNCDMDAIVAIAREHNLLLIEDVAQAIGGNYKGKRLGTFGDAGCFSFNVDKIISCGEGGLVCFRNEELYKKALKLHDTPVSFGATHREYLADLKPEPAHSMRVSEIQSAIMRVQLRRLDSILGVLRGKKALWRAALPAIPAADPAGDCGTTVHLNLGDPMRAASFAQALTKDGVVAMPLYAKPAYCFWQWLSIMGMEEAQMKRVQIEFANDKLRLSSIVRVQMDYENPPEDHVRKAKALYT